VESIHRKRGKVMSTVWKVYIDYGSGYGWVPVNWAPTFETESEANEWINGDHGWESSVRAIEMEVEDD
jgi:recombination DNA repair RAD52 pathway protein